MSALMPVPSTPVAADIERVLVGGDLSKLTPEQRIVYMRQVCSSLGLNPLTQPFEYIVLNGKLSLYARKACTEQLRLLRGVSIEKPEITFQDDWILVSVTARDKDNRTDADLGVVSRKDMRGDFGNALMKAVTKAKRRVTLSICGLGMLDESEVESLPGARPVPVDTATGEVLEPPQLPAASTPEATSSTAISEPQRKRLFALAKQHGWTTAALKAWLASIGIESTSAIGRDEYDDVIAGIEGGHQESQPVAAKAAIDAEVF